MIKAILTDIEGTTTSVAFVYDTLFPYFKNNIEKLLGLLDVEEVKSNFLAIKKQLDEQDPESVSNEAVIQQLKAWVAEDKKVTELKNLQGILWKEAYETGEIKGHVYPDVVSNLKKWSQAGISLNVYSSGSVAAQKLLFGYSEEGDLTPLFDLYFDTKVGHKREIASYRKIAEALAMSAESILFLSDIKEELDAAQAAGIRTIQLVRPGTKACSEHTIVKDFSGIDLGTYQ